jgi:hypothetical protein
MFFMHSHRNFRFSWHLTQDGNAKRPSLPEFSNSGSPIHPIPIRQGMIGDHTLLDRTMRPQLLSADEGNRERIDPLAPPLANGSNTRDLTVFQAVR